MTTLCGSWTRGADGSALHRALRANRNSREGAGVRAESTQRPHGTDTERAWMDPCANGRRLIEIAGAAGWFPAATPPVRDRPDGPWP